MPRSIFFMVLFCLISFAVSAQPDDIGAGTTATNPPPIEANQPPAEINQPPLNPEITPTKTTQEIWLSLGVLVFGLAVVFAQVFLLNKRDEAESLSDSLKYLSITLIIVGSLFLVTAGYGNSQIAPIIGLLGTVAGYLLGRSAGVPGTVPKK